MRKYFLFGFFGLGLGLTGACNDAGTGNGTPASPSVRLLLESMCDVSLRCCSRGEVDYYHGPYVDAENCVDRLFEQASRTTIAGVPFSELQEPGTAVYVPNLGALDQAVQDGRTKIDAAALEACQEHLADLACNEPAAEEEAEGCQPTPAAPEETPCALDKLFVGRLGVGSACSSTGGLSLECAPGLFCAGGLGLGVTGRCVEAQEEGELCNDDHECADELYCSELDGSCQRPRAEGEVCVFADRNDPAPAPETLLVRCEDHLSCDPITNTCVARCQAGASCLSDEDCDAEAELTCILGRCSQPRGEGLPCQSAEHCEEEFYCGPDVLDPTQSFCSVKKQDSEDCTDHLECASGYCSADTNQCTPAVAVGEPCPSGLDAQCDGGRCAQEETTASSGYCAAADECPNSGSCDTYYGTCGTYCVAIKQDGAACTLDNECESGECIAGFCRTSPLDLGVACDDASDCESEFCSHDDEPVCAELPLPLNEPCFSGDECASGVCFASTPGEPPTCGNGLDEGESCGAAGQAPCNPKELYCDVEESEAPVCVRLKETGEICKTSVECRGDCVPRHGRSMCSPAAPEDEAVCGGTDPLRPPGEEPEDAGSDADAD